MHSNHTTEQTINWLQLAININAVPSEMQLEASEHFSMLYPYDNRLKSFFMTSKTIPPQPVYTIRKSPHDGSDEIVFDVLDHNGNHITSTFPSPFDVGNNIIIGPNKNNHIVINNCFFDIADNSMKFLPRSKLPHSENTEKPVALHPTKKIVCMSYVNLNYTYHPCHLYLLDLQKDTEEERFTRNFIPDIYPCASRPYRRIFFGPDIEGVPTLWVKCHAEIINLFKWAKPHRISNFGIETDNITYESNGQEIYDYFCDSNNPDQLLVFIAQNKDICYSNENNKDLAKELTVSFRSDYKKPAKNNNYVTHNLNVSQLLAPTCYIGSPYMLPRVIHRGIDGIKEVDNHNPSHVLHVIKEQNWETKEWFLRQMKALVLLNALKQFSEQKHSDEDEKELVRLMRTNPDKYKIILHAQQIDKVKDFLKVLQQKYGDKK